MANELNDIQAEVAEYYSARLAQYGETPAGVDWNGLESQRLRFAQLCKLVDPARPFSVNDLGCGYGALFDYLGEHYTDFAYTGCDVSADMVAAAQKRLAHAPQAKFVAAAEPPTVADYGLASGIFNVRLDRGDDEWQAYLHATLDILDRISTRGFAFNCLTSYSDPDKMVAKLYYADPRELFDRCKRRYSRQVALLHDYGLYEFTLLVRKVL